MNPVYSLPQETDMKSTILRVLMACTACLLASAAIAETGQETGHASADSTANACNTAVFAARQNLPRNARAVKSDCECDQRRNALGRIDCYATVTWQRPDR
jgi:hypothetical protein